MPTHNADLTRRTECGGGPLAFPSGASPSKADPDSGQLPRARENQPTAGWELWCFSWEEKRPKNSECQDHKRGDSVSTTTREATLSPSHTSQTSSPGPRAASSTLLPSASSQSSSKPTAVSMWVSLGHTPPLTFRSTPLLGSWTISASDSSYVPTLPSNVKTSTRVTPPKQGFPIHTAGLYDDKHSGTGAIPVSGL